MSRSCDACRTRKVRCIREDPLNQSVPCQHCLDLRIECKYEYRPKRRGPKNQYVSRMQEGRLQEIGRPSSSTIPKSTSPEIMEPSQFTRDNISPQGRWPTDIDLLPPLDYHYLPHRLEEVAPRALLLQLIALFFDFVYPGIPCIHKPTFMLDLDSRREERDPIFFALVMSLVATTLAQVPGLCVPLDAATVKSLAKRCYEASRRITVVTHDPPTTMHVILRYFDVCYLYWICNASTSQRAAFGEAVEIGFSLGFHLEERYVDLDPIENQMRRRIFWTLYGADKSEAIERSCHIIIRSEDCTVGFPMPIDDEYITVNGYLQQPEDKTPMVAGLIHLSRIFALLGETLVRIRIDERLPPEGAFIATRLEEIDGIHTKIMTVLDDLPRALRLNEMRTPTSNTGESALQQVDEYFQDANVMKMNAMNAFQVKQADLYVTQQQARFVVEKYRDHLLGLDPEIVQQGRDLVMEDLLRILHSLPLQAIAANGPPICHKIRFIASALLTDSSPADSTNWTRSQTYLWEFLNVLTEIEKQFSVISDKAGGDGE